jgi:hypothetical protein
VACTGIVARVLGRRASVMTLVAVLAPFMTDAKLASQVATAAIGLAVGLAIGSLVSGAARCAIRLGRQAPRLPER